MQIVCYVVALLDYSIQMHGMVESAPQSCRRYF